MANEKPKINEQAGKTPSAADLDAVAEEQRIAAVTEPSLEEMQREIAQLELEAKRLQLEELRISTEEAKARRAVKKRENAERQAQLRQEVANQKAIESQCSHLQGGRPDDILNGDGKPALTVTRMLDGKTHLIQCPRCRLKRLTPHPNLAKTDPEKYEHDKAEFDELMKMAKRSGLDPIMGPTFEFSRDGVNFLPERV